MRALALVLATLVPVSASAQTVFYRCVKNGSVWMTNYRIQDAKCTVYARFRMSARSENPSKSPAAAPGAIPPPEPLPNPGLRTADRKGTDRPALDAIMARAAADHGIPVALLKAVIEVESGFQPDAVSAAGAQGLMQLMPGTADFLDVSDPFDPEQNIQGGAKLLRHLSDRFKGDIEKTIGAYFSGPTRVARAGGLPSDRCAAYVKHVLRLYQKYSAP
jgi:soluble lytic murein transglycosylase-like protein